MTVPNVDNFELVIGHLALAINAVSVMQEGKNEIDMTDIVEDFLNFNAEKFAAYQRGERPYRYLNFQEVKKSGNPDAPTQIRAVIVVQNAFQGANEREYLDLIFTYLQKVLKVSMHRIDEEKKYQIMRDIGESNRFTCIKFLRFVWAMFGDEDNPGKGLFPEVYQARIINAGELERQVLGGKSIFDPSVVGIIKSTLIKDTMAISDQPENQPDLFDGRIMVFFRQPAFKGESGHVGVGKLTAQRDKNGDLVRFLISFIEVDGNTGQAYSGYRVDMDDFRTHLFMGTQSKEGFTTRAAGWMFLRD